MHVFRMVSNEARFLETAETTTGGFCKKGVLRNFTKFLGKQLCQSLVFNNAAGLLRTPFLQNTSGQLLLKLKDS